jgi:glutathione-independent formaldehyde dehydrogenase
MTVAEPVSALRGNVQLIKLGEVPKAYADFDKGASKKFVIDPHKMVA